MASDSSNVLYTAGIRRDAPFQGRILLTRPPRESSKRGNSKAPTSEIGSHHEVDIAAFRVPPIYLNLRDDLAGIIKADPTTCSRTRVTGIFDRK